MYALLGGLGFICYFMIDVEHLEPEEIKDKKALNCAGIEHDNMPTIIKLSILFASDALGGAFITQTFISLYYQERYNVNFDEIGVYLFICNVISGISGVLSSKLVNCIGALATMIYTHLPSNIFLILIFITSNPTLSIIFLFGRFCISQMDVPARQTFVTLLVSPNERSAANGITNIARSVGLSLGLGINGYLIGMTSDHWAFSLPFLIAGVIKIVYDLTIGCFFLWNKKKEQSKYEVGAVEIVESSKTDI